MRALLTIWLAWSSGSLQPVAVKGISDAVAVLAMPERSCAAHQSGKVSCWGRRAPGYQMAAPGTRRFDTVPRPARDLRLIRGERAGRPLLCLIPDRAAQIRCVDDFGIWHAPLPSDRLSVPRPGRDPYEGIALEEDVSQVSAGAMGTCLVRAGGGLACRGYEFSGRPEMHSFSSPDGAITSIESDPPPARPVALASHVRMVSVGNGTLCAATDAGEVLCRRYGQPALIPVPGLTRIRTVVVGDNEACAIGDGGRVRCWREGSVGPGVPRRVPIAGVVALSLALDHACALKRDGTVACWGANDFGQLGDGRASPRGCE